MKSRSCEEKDYIVVHVKVKAKRILNMSISFLFSSSLLVFPKINKHSWLIFLWKDIFQNCWPLCTSRKRRIRLRNGKTWLIHPLYPRGVYYITAENSLRLNWINIVSNLKENKCLCQEMKNSRWKENAYISQFSYYISLHTAYSHTQTLFIRITSFFIHFI